MSVYLITGASSDVGTALIDRLYREGDVFIAQGAGAGVTVGMNPFNLSNT